MQNILNKYLLFFFVLFLTISASANITFEKNKLPNGGDTIPLIEKCIQAGTSAIEGSADYEVWGYPYKNKRKKNRNIRNSKFPCDFVFPVKLINFSLELFEYAKFPDAKNAIIQLLWILAWLIYIIPLLIISIITMIIGIVYLIAIISLFVAVFFGIIIGILFLLGVTFGFWAIFLSILGGLLLGGLSYLLILNLCS